MKRNGNGGNDHEGNGVSTDEPPRARYLTGKAAANDVGGLVIATRAELEELIEIALDKALDARDARKGVVATGWLDRNALAKELGCSASKVDRLRERGLPTEIFGDVPRFELAAARDWMRRQKRKPKAEK